MSLVLRIIRSIHGTTENLPRNVSLKLWQKLVLWDRHPCSKFQIACHLFLYITRVIFFNFGKGLRIKLVSLFQKNDI